MNTTITQLILTLIIFVGFYPSSANSAPYLRHDINNNDCCNDEVDDRLFMEPPSSPNTDNLLYIPFTEITIRDFGIHKYVVNRNIKTIMTYYTDSHLMNIITKSLNQSTFEITRLVKQNIHEFNAMAENKFISNFMDFWVAFRLIQLSEFSSNNLDVLANIIKDTHMPINNNNEL
jgi:hypothetical protein